MIKAFLKKLICMHPNWTEDRWKSPISPTSRKFALVGHKDWRTSENYWACTKCGKVKNLGWNRTGANLPINFT